MILANTLSIIRHIPPFIFWVALVYRAAESILKLKRGNAFDNCAFIYDGLFIVA